MSRKAPSLGPNTLGLVEDAPTDLFLAVLAVREHGNEPDLKLPEQVSDPHDDHAVYAFRQDVIESLSKFDPDELRPAGQCFRRNAVPDGQTGHRIVKLRTGHPLRKLYDR